MRVFAQEDAEVERFDGLLAATYRIAKQAALLQGITDGAAAFRIPLETYSQCISSSCYAR